MRKTKKMALTLALIGLLAAGCSSKEDGTPGTNSGTTSSGSNTPSEQIPPSEQNGGESNNSNGYNSGGNDNNGRKPGENQVWDYANGFSIKELEQALRATGAIKTAGEPYDVSGTNMTEATRYGNIVIGTYNCDLVDEALELYQKGSMEINGKKVRVANMIGNYLLIVLDGDISQESIAAFSAVGGL